MSSSRSLLPPFTLESRQELRPRRGLARLQHDQALVVLAVGDRTCARGAGGRYALQVDVPEQAEMKNGARMDRERAKELLGDVEAAATSANSAEVR